MGFNEFMEINDIVIAVRDTIIDESGLINEIRRVLIEMDLGNKEHLEERDIAVISKLINRDKIIREKHD